MRAFIYARYSTSKQNEHSIDDQVRSCRDFADAKGHTVVGTYADAAESGSHLHRDDLRRMLDDLEKKPRAGDAVIVDNLSRLSRDVGDFWSIVFGDFVSLGVILFDVMTGLPSDDPNAKGTWAAIATANQFMIEATRAQSHRALKMRARDGFATGGLIYGFDASPLDGATEENPRHRYHVDLDEALIIVRIFEMYDAGYGYSRIAKTLNDEGVESPAGGTRWKAKRRGWSPATIGVILRNEKYIGRFIWNTSRWVRPSGRKARKRIARPTSEHITRDLPELAVVGRDLWDRVQVRLASQNAKTGGRGGRPTGTGTRPSLWSGLMRCATCGGSMSIVGGRTTKTPWRTYGCSAAKNKGPSICTNTMAVSEGKVNESLLAGLTEVLESPDVVKRVVAAFERRLAHLESSGPPDKEMKELDRLIREKEIGIERLTEALMKRPDSEAILAKLSEQEPHLAALRRRRTDLTPRPKAASARVPAVEVVAKYLAELSAVLSSNPESAREFLARHVGRVTMTPTVDGLGRRAYRATGALGLDNLVTATGSPRSGEPVCGNSGSGGRI